MGIVPVPNFVSDILYLPGHDIRYIRMEKVIMEHLDLVFGQYEVSDRNYICVTRNADIAPDDELLEVNDDFRYLMKQTLHKRRRMAVVRLDAALDCRIWRSISARNSTSQRSRSSAPRCP